MISRRPRSLSRRYVRALRHTEEGVWGCGGRAGERARTSLLLLFCTFLFFAVCVYIFARAVLDSRLGVACRNTCSLSILAMACVHRSVCRVRYQELCTVYSSLHSTEPQSAVASRDTARLAALTRGARTLRTRSKGVGLEWVTQGCFWDMARRRAGDAQESDAARCAVMCAVP